MSANNPQDFLNDLFGLTSKVAIVTGGTGVLGGAMARGLAKAGAKVVIVGRRREKAEAVAAELESIGAEAIGIPADVLSKEDLVALRDAVAEKWGTIDILINAAGGTIPEATVQPNQTIFDMPLEPMKYIIDLNLLGTLLPSQILGEVMAKQGKGAIVNISSMAVPRATTRAVAYSAGKAAMENFTRWMAVELALKFGEGLRVNAIAPGFFLGDQNRRLLTNEDGTPTPRGQSVINMTPVRRFGEPDELVGAAIWLCSAGAKFVNGATIMVDGGVNAYSGV